MSVKTLRGNLSQKLNNGVDTFGAEDINCRAFPLKTSFKEMLELITGIDSTNMNLDDFMNLYKSKRFEDSSDIELFKNIIDPTNKENLNKYYCKNAVVVSRLYFSEDDPRQVSWSEYGDHYVSDEPLKIEVKNMGTVATPKDIYLETPINFVHDSTVSSLFKKRIGIPIVGTVLNPGQSSIIEQYIAIPRNSNGTMKPTTLEYKTGRYLNKRYLFKSLLKRNNYWQTNKMQIVIGPALAPIKSYEIE